MLEEAIGHHRAALKRNPLSPEYRDCLRDAYSALAKTFLGMRKHSDAAKAALELPGIFPDNWEGYYLGSRYLARCALLAQSDADLSEAERARLSQAYADRASRLRREAFQRIPETSRGASKSNNLAWFLATCPDAKLRDPAKALSLAEKAVAAQPNTYAYLNTLGVVYYRLGQHPKAIETLQKAIQADKSGGNAFDFFFLAMARWQLGDKDEARKWYQKGVEWMEQKKAQDDEELRRFRAEAQGLLGIGEKPKAGKEKPK